VLKVIVAPNSFKGSLPASKAAAAIARGVREGRPDAEIVEIPVADGGEGTVEALVSARKGIYGSAEVEGPLGDPVQATYGLIDDGRTGVVELASASGLTLIPTEKRDPRKTSTYGFGQLLEAVRKEGVASIIAGIGGFATGRFTTPEEVATLITFLASGRAGNITGVNYIIDGGLIKTT